MAGGAGQGALGDGVFKRAAARPGAVAPASTPRRQPPWSGKFEARGKKWTSGVAGRKGGSGEVGRSRVRRDGSRREPLSVMGLGRGLPGAKAGQKMVPAGCNLVHSHPCRAPRRWRLGAPDDLGQGAGGERADLTAKFCCLGAHLAIESWTCDLLLRRQCRRPSRPFLSAPAPGTTTARCPEPAPSLRRARTIGPQGWRGRR